MDIRQIRRNLSRALYLHHSAETHLHVGLRLAIVLIFRFEQEVGLRFIYLCFSKEEVESQFVRLWLHFEYVGKALLILAALEGLLIIYVASVIDVLAVIVFSS